MRGNRLLGDNKAALLLDRHAGDTVAVLLEGEFGGDEIVDHLSLQRSLRPWAWE